MRPEQRKSGDKDMRNDDADTFDRLAVALNGFINNRVGIPNPFQNKVPAAWLALTQAVDEERSEQRPN